MTTRRVKVALWGYGRIASQFHLPLLLANPNVQLVAVAEADATQRALLGQRAPGLAVFDDYRQTLGGPQHPDAVVIALPTPLHAAAACAAFEAGCHVYLEKPLARSPDEGQQILAAWRSAGVVCMLGHNFRFHPLYQQALGARDTLGGLRGVRALMSSATVAAPSWKQDATLGGGALLELASHMVDMAALFVDGFRRVWATEQAFELPADTVSLHLEALNGTPVQILASMTSVREHQFALYGRERRIVVDLAEPLRLDVRTRDHRRARTKRVLARLQALAPRNLLLSPGYEPSFGLALNAFVHAAGGGVLAPYAATPEDGLRTQYVLAAAEEAIRTGQHVSIDQGTQEHTGARSAGL